VILGAQNENGFSKMNPEEVRKFRSELNQSRRLGELSVHHFKAMELQLRDCEAKKEKSCVVYRDLNEGTGFFTEWEGDPVLWTNAHFVEWRLKSAKSMVDAVLKDPIKRAISYKGALDRLLSGQLKPRISVFNQKDELIFSGDAEFRFLPKETKESAQSGTFYAEDNDYVGLHLKLDRPVTPFPVGVAVPEGDNLFIAGYPHCNNCKSAEAFGVMENRDRWPFPNANHSGLFATKGERLSPEVAADLMGIEREAMKNYKLDQMLFYNADSIYGMSGSPILNSRCEVIGIHSGGKSYSVFDKTLRVSRGVRPSAFNRSAQ
jgi:hypothetical protein